MANNNQRKLPKFNIFWMYGLIILALLMFYYWQNNEVSQPVSWTQFESWVQKGGVTSITVYTNKNTAEAVLSDSLAKEMFKGKQYAPTPGTPTKMVTHIPSSDKFDEKVEQWRQKGVFKGDVKYDQASDFSMAFWTFGPIVLLVLLWFFLLKRMNGGAGGGGGIFNVGKSKARLFDKDNANKVTFRDVAGLAEAKVEIAEIVDFLKNPKHYTELGGKIPKGALLVGPPGTGKTLLAKAVAGEADVPFFSMSGSDFVEMFVGVGASRVRDLFRQAKEKAPCIVFIDEIDAVGRARGNKANLGGNDERESTLNQLLTEMDGFGSNSGVIILAATNRADILDKALLRAGRFDRQIYVELPELSDRKEIFQVHLRDVKTDGSVDLDLLSRQTPGFSGADIANVCNEAALIAARHKKQAVQRQDFMDAIDRIVGGLEKRSKVITDEERRSIAVHEAGHATVSWHLRYGDPLIKVTIVPRGKALGAAWYMPEERQIEPKQALLDKICSLMAGRVAEDMFMGFIDTGALNDLERATKIAYAMVTYYGMSDKLPNISYYDTSGDAYGFTKPYSENRAQTIDEEVQHIIDSQYERARQILDQYQQGHHQLAELLQQREVIYTEDAERIFGPRQWQSRTEEILKENAADSSAEEHVVGNGDDAASATPPPFEQNESSNH
ncbi:MAG: ATP-dependent zinc metalloprotease FtsH [Muribaculaceae bacterium]|jgi:cell division protease FtsH|nr:ATP-dependent zinc metalloprotease FtsH [Muribaculaceae bacterium]